jgi:hypothetical protein
VLGPVVFGGPAVALVIHLRRYRCRACRAILVVGPRGLLAGRCYSAPAVASALAAVASGQTSAAVRSCTCPHGTVGAAAAERWVTLVRWLDAAQAGTLLAVAGLGELGRRAVAEHVTLALAARGGHTPGAAVGASAFAGAALAA